MGTVLSISLPVDQPFSRCWDCATEPVSLIHKFQENLNKLKSQLQELQADRNDVKRSVDAAERSGMLPLDRVQWWFSSVESKETEVMELISKCETDQRNNKWSFKYKIGKEIATKSADLENLKGLGKFDRVAEENTFASQILYFQENLNKLKIQLQELQAERNDVKRRVDAAEISGKLPLNRVQWWFSRVESMETEVTELITKCETDQGNNEWSFKYEIGKEIATKSADLENLKGLGQFDRVAEENTNPPWVEPRPLDPTVGLQSTFDSVWKLLTQDDDIGTIGIYGMGGVGKTTLMSQINNHFLKGRHHFELVIWIVVSKDARMEKIQNDLGKKIGCYNHEWENKLNMDEKVVAIFNILRQKRFVLLLDDIWERIHLRKLGIPSPDKDNMSKIVFTTRSEIVCGKMEAQKKIKVECLPWKEAWELFRRKVGEDVLNIHPEIHDIAQDVAKECGGLPLALITIGRAMACMQTPQEWRYALEILRKSAAEFSGMEEEVFSLLKFSYDNLPDVRMKSCFLRVALLPEDFEIRNISLINYWIGEGFLDGYNSTEEAHCYGYFIIGTLLHACLLEYANTSVDRDSVKMHDVVRDMALWILSENGNAKDTLIVQTGMQLQRIPEVGKWSLATKISLTQNNIEELVEALNCPNLSILLLGSNRISLISPGFFEFMPSLTVLDLSGNDLVELPLAVTKLISLHYLNLSYNQRLREIPSEFGNLVKLKYLNLDDTSVQFIGDEVLSCLTSLQVLEFTFQRYGYIEYQYNGYVERIEGLKCLDYLSITVGSIPAFQKLTSSTKLRNCTRILLIDHFNSSELDISSLENMKYLDRLDIYACEELQDMTFDNIMRGETEQAHPQHCPNNGIINKVCFRSLTRVFIVDCLKLRDATWLIFIPNLRRLFIMSCQAMEAVICCEKWRQFGGVEGEPNLFRKLQSLQLRSLDKLKSINWESLQLKTLRMLVVTNCQQLKKLPLNSTSANGGQHLVIKGQQSWWDNLDWEDDNTRNNFLHCFNKDGSEET